MYVLMERPTFSARTALRVLTAGCFCAVLIAITPHLVHHAFDRHQGRPECPLLLVSLQATGHATPDPPALPEPGLLGPVRLPEVLVHRPLLCPARPQPRAPPATV